MATVDPGENPGGIIVSNISSGKHLGGREERLSTDRTDDRPKLGLKDSSTVGTKVTDTNTPRIGRGRDSVWQTEDEVRQNLYVLCALTVTQGVLSDDKERAPGRKEEGKEVEDRDR